MNSTNIRSRLAAFLILSAVLACSEKQPAAAAMAGHDSMPMPMSHAGMDMKITLPPGSIVKVADVQFMQGMISHHSQAIFMSRLAMQAGASPRLQKFAAKIDQSQTAEIALMQRWLRSMDQFAPDTASYHTMQMPGMLTKEQIATLEKARGVEFEHQFLVMMIQHHEGALRMVKDLYASSGAAQEVDVSAFANDIDVVQTAEIDAMRKMLSDLQGS